MTKKAIEAGGRGEESVEVVVPEITTGLTEVENTSAQPFNLTEGVMVQYVMPDATNRAGVVVKVVDDLKGIVLLKLFLTPTDDPHQGRLAQGKPVEYWPYEVGPTTPGTWHWMPE